MFMLFPRQVKCWLQDWGRDGWVCVFPITGVARSSFCVAYVCTYERMCVFVTENVWVRERVCVREKESVCRSVFVCVEESQKLHVCVCERASSAVCSYWNPQRACPDPVLTWESRHGPARSLCDTNRLPILFLVYAELKCTRSDMNYKAPIANPLRGLELESFWSNDVICWFQCWNGWKVSVTLCVCYCI